MYLKKRGNGARREEKAKGNGNDPMGSFRKASAVAKGAKVVGG